jgi:hypothetical protein
MTSAGSRSTWVQGRLSTAERRCIAVAEQECVSPRDEKGPARGPCHLQSACLRFAVVGPGRASTVLALPEPIAITVHLEDVDVMGEAAEERTGQALGAEHAGPFVEGQITGDDDRGPLIALAEHLEQQLGTGW